MRTIGEFKLVSVWVHPTHLVASAIMLMEGHGVKVLPVVAADRLIGTVGLDSLRAADPQSEVGSYVEPPKLVLARDVPVRTAAEQFVRADTDRAVVFESGRVYGIVTAIMLLAELGRSWDPLTNLSWSDTLREWGIERLSSGKEITILFIDLDDFGRYNKIHGHVVGDRILRKIAQSLKQCIDPERDLLVRYAGDEFAIGTTRSLDSASRLAQELQSASAQAFGDEPELAVTFSVGLSGGKRTKERESMHFAATLDALINLASRDAEQRKQKRRESMPSPNAGSTGSVGTPSEAGTPSVEVDSSDGSEESAARPRVMFVLANEATPSAPTTVGVHWEGAFPTGIHMRGTVPLIKSVAIATANALSQCSERKIEICEVILSEPAPGSFIVTVSATLEDEGVHLSVAATQPVNEMLYETIAETVIDAYMQHNDNSSGESAKLIDMYGDGFRHAE